MEEYEINESTNALIPLTENKTKVIEDYRSCEINKKTLKIVDESCKYFGSSYQGRFEGAKKMLGPKIYKAPIIVEESKEMIYFPTGSSRAADCAWFSLKKVKNVERKGYNTLVEFQSNQKIEVKISFESFQNQLLRASYLSTILRERKQK